MKDNVLRLQRRRRGRPIRWPRPVSPTKEERRALQYQADRFGVHVDDIIIWAVRWGLAHLEYREDPHK